MSSRRSRPERALHLLEWGLGAAAKRLVPGLRPRAFHNRVLREYLAHLGGDVINVSGWEDRDKEGGFYRGYYGACRRYVVSNIHGDRGMTPGLAPGVGSVYLDLEESLAPELRGAFDVVFSHTVLEHVHRVHLALENLAELSRDVVVVVVPFSQSVHYTRSFGDHVRLSPPFLRRFFEDRGFSVLLSVCNDQAFFPVYVTMIASRAPERHADAFGDAPRSYEVQIRPGRWGRYGMSGLDVPAD